MPICHGVGWPNTSASAAPALASKIPKISAVARNRDNTGIVLGSELPRSRPLPAVPTPRSQHMHIKYMFTMQHYGVDFSIPAAAGGVLHRACGLDGLRRVWSRQSRRTALAVRFRRH
jgi:hypothetical protein